MDRIKTGLAALAATAMLLTAPARAAAPGDAEKLRRLDIMLMVTALRCRTTADNFQSDFADFEAAHLPELNDAAISVANGVPVAARAEIPRAAERDAPTAPRGRRGNCASVAHVATRSTGGRGASTTTVERAA